jgi:hypothetical protein
MSKYDFQMRLILEIIFEKKEKLHKQNPDGYPGRYYTVLRNTPAIPEFFGVKIESVVVKNGSPKQV